MSETHSNNDYSIIPKFDKSAHRFIITLEPGEKHLDIHYTLDGSEPDSSSPKYNKPMQLKSTATLKAGAFRDGEPYGEGIEKEFYFHAGLGKPVTLTSPYSYKYTAGGPDGLTDGITGSLVFRDGFWQGFEQDDFEAVVDLGKPMVISTIKTNFLQNSGSWIFMPTSVEFSVSTDNKNFQLLKTLTHSISPKKQDGLIRESELIDMNVTARYIKIFAKNIGTCPEWHPGAGGKAWIFVDEIIVNPEE